MYYYNSFLLWNYDFQFWKISAHLCFYVAGGWRGILAWNHLCTWLGRHQSVIICQRTSTHCGPPMVTTSDHSVMHTNLRLLPTSQRASPAWTWEVVSKNTHNTRQHQQHWNYMYHDKTNILTDAIATLKNPKITNINTITSPHLNQFTSPYW